MSTGHLDNSLITGLEDSLVLLYRSGTSEDWQIETHSTLVKSGSATDKIGYITVDTLKKGEYCLGYRDYSVGLNNHIHTKRTYFTITPNPASETFLIKMNTTEHKKYMISIFDLEGKEVYNNIINTTDPLIWNPKNIHKGVYLINLLIDGKIIETKKAVYQ